MTSSDSLAVLRAEIYPAGGAGSVSKSWEVSSGFGGSGVTCYPDGFLEVDAVALVAGTGEGGDSPAAVRLRFEDVGGLLGIHVHDDRSWPAGLGHRLLPSQALDPGSGLRVDVEVASLRGLIPASVCSI